MPSPGFFKPVPIPGRPGGPFFFLDRKPWRAPYNRHRCVTERAPANSSPDLCPFRPSCPGPGGRPPAPCKPSFSAPLSDPKVEIRSRRKIMSRFASRRSEYLPTHYYNIKADLPTAPARPCTPRPGSRSLPSDLEGLFSKGFIGHEIATEREVPIPREVLEAYSIFRPDPARPRRRAREDTWIRPPESSTSTKASARSAATRRIRPSCRPGSRPRRASRP